MHSNPANGFFKEQHSHSYELLMGSGKGQAETSRKAKNRPPSVRFDNSNSGSSCSADESHHSFLGNNLTLSYMS